MWPTVIVQVLSADLKPNVMLELWKLYIFSIESQSELYSNITYGGNKVDYKSENDDIYSVL